LSSAQDSVDLLIAAIAFAIEGMGRLPDPHRSESNIADLKRKLAEMAPDNVANLQSVARSSVDILLGVKPEDPRDFA
jgi:hypothetical protein